MNSESLFISRGSSFSQFSDNWVKSFAGYYAISRETLAQT